MSVFVRAIPVLLVCLVLFSACSPSSPPDHFAYADTAFTAAIRGTYTPADGIPRPIAATVSVEEPRPNRDLSDRSMTLSFSQPSALEGATVSTAFEADPQGRILRTVTFSYPSSYGEVKITSEEEAFDGFLRFAEALLPLGDVTGISPVSEDGTRIVTRCTADGMREAVFLFSDEENLPLRVVVTDAARQERIEVTITQICE